MNKKSNNHLVRNKVIPFRVTEAERVQILERAFSCSMDLSNFCREAALNKYILPKASPYDLNVVRLLKNDLKEYKTNFNRIASLIKTRDIFLLNEIAILVSKIDIILKKYEYDWKGQSE